MNFKSLKILILSGLVLFIFCSNKTRIVSDFFNVGFKNWYIDDSSIWTLINIDGDNIIHLQKPGNAKGYKAPKSIAILDFQELANFEMVVRAKCLTDISNKRLDICLICGYQDSLHYFYAPFSGNSDKVHNIFAEVIHSDCNKIYRKNPEILMHC